MTTHRLSAEYPPLAMPHPPAVFADGGDDGDKRPNGEHTSGPLVGAGGSAADTSINKLKQILQKRDPVLGKGKRLL